MFSSISERDSLLSSIRALSLNTLHESQAEDNAHSDSTSLAPDALQLEQIATLADAWGFAQDYHFHLTNTRLLDQLRRETRLTLEVRRLQGKKNEDELVKELGVICKALNDAGIVYVLLKGAALIAGGYTNCAGQRSHGDIDLLVNYEDLDRTYDVLQACDFNSVMSLKRPVQDYWQAKHLPPMTSQAFKYKLELHHIPLGNTTRYSSAYTTSDYLNSRRKICFEDIVTYIPAPEILLYSAFFHSELSDVNSLVNINNYRAMIDLSMIVRKDAEILRWAEIEQKIRATGCERQFNTFLYHTARCIDQSLSAIEGFPRVSTKSVFLRNMNEVIEFPAKTVAAMVMTFRELRRWHSKEVRLERKILLDSNPDEWKYKPIYQQILNPALLVKRAKGFLRIVRR